MLKPTFKLRQTLARLTPVWVGKAIYFSIFYFLKIAVPFHLFLFGKIRVTRAFKIATIWPRNSLLTHTFRPFLSDLDLTILFSDDSTPQEIDAVISAMHDYKKILKVFSEFNTYTLHDCQSSIDCCNRVELSRDPRLSRFMTGHARAGAPNQFEKAAYLLRALESNIERLINAPEDQMSKWHYHFQLCGWVAPNELNYGTILAYILEQIYDGPAPKAVFLSAVRFLNERYNRVAHHLLSVNAAVVALFPHNFCIFDVKNFEIEAPLQNVQEAQLRFETWGLMSQWRQYRWQGPDRVDSFKQHAKNLRSSYEQYSFLRKLQDITF